MHVLLRTIVFIALFATPLLGFTQSAEEATAHLRKTNTQLSHLLAGNLNDNDITEIYRLSSTLETSLIQLTNEASTLERSKALQLLIGDADNLRFFSEHRKRKDTLEHGKRYLENSAQLLN